MKKYQGFTLIELVITLAIVAILASIALPSYKEYVARSRRADVKAVLLQGAQFMERIYTERGSYDRKSDGTVGATLDDIGFPANFQHAPINATNATAFYTIGLSGALGVDSFTLEATPKNAQSSDKCGKFTISNTGEKNINSLPSGSTATANECWN